MKPELTFEQLKNQVPIGTPKMVGFVPSTTINEGLKKKKLLSVATGMFQKLKP